MARFNSLVAASSYAAACVLAVAPAATAQSGPITGAGGNSFTTTNVTHSVAGGFDTITFYGTASVSGGTFASGLTLVPIMGFPAPPGGYLQSIYTLPTNGNFYNGALATFKVPTSDKNTYYGFLEFTSATQIGNVTVPGGSADALIIISAVPEPSSLAFGLLASGSVVGLIARARRRA